MYFSPIKIITSYTAPEDESGTLAAVTENVEANEIALVETGNEDGNETEFYSKLF